MITYTIVRLTKLWEIHIRRFHPDFTAAQHHGWLWEASSTKQSPLNVGIAPRIPLACSITPALNLHAIHPTIAKVWKFEKFYHSSWSLKMRGQSNCLTMPPAPPHKLTLNCIIVSIVSRIIVDSVTSDFFDMVNFVSWEALQAFYRYSSVSISHAPHLWDQAPHKGVSIFLCENFCLIADEWIIIFVRPSAWDP